MNGFISKLKKLQTEYTAYVEMLFRSMQPKITASYMCQISIKAKEDYQYSFMTCLWGRLGFSL